MVIRFLALVQP